MLSHAEITTLLIGVGLLLGMARILAEVARRVGQPSVVGEILAGLLLGPTVLGTVWPEANQALFPSSGGLPAARSALTTLSVTLFLLVAGMELDLTKILKRRRAAVMISLGGIVVPFALGWVPGCLAPAWMGAGQVATPMLFALFFGTAMAISALPVIAKILMDLQLFRTELGATIIASAVIDDLCGWVIFGIILAMMGAQGGEGAAAVAAAAGGARPEVWLSVLLVVGFAAGMLTIGRWLINAVLPWIQAHTAWPGGVLGFALVGCVLCAAFTEWIGVHAIFGAFFFGVALGDSRHLRASTRATIDQFVSFIFAPLFFASIGLRVNFAANFDLPLVLVVLAIACAGKFSGCAMAGRLAGLPGRESLAIAAGMNARGAMEIILGLLAREAGLISDRLFVALVVMALVTSMAAGTMMQKFLGRPKPVRFVDFASGKTLVPLSARTRIDAVAELGRVAAEAGKVDLQMVVDAALAREQVLHSGVGQGVAVPHARVAGLGQAVVAIGLSPEGIAWGSRDGRAVRIVVFLLTPEEDARLHLDLLASIAAGLREPTAVELAVGAKNWTEFLAAIKTSAGESGAR